MQHPVDERWLLLNEKILYYTLYLQLGDKFLELQ